MLATLSALTLRIFSNPYSNVLQKKLTQNGINPCVVNFFTYFGLSILCLFFILNLGYVPLQAWGFAILGGLFGALGNGFLVKALECGELSVLGPINSYKSVVAMIFGIFLLGEIPSLFGILGVFLIIYGSYFIFGKGEFRFGLLKRKDIQYRFLALIFTGCEAVFIKSVINLTDVMTSFIFWCLFGALFSLFFTRFRFQKFSKQNMLLLFGLILSTGIMQLSTNFVFNYMNVSYALALFQLSILLSVFFGWKFFDEKDIWRKLLGSVIMICGAVVIILT